MEKIEVRNSVESAEAAGASTLRKSRSLRLDKQIIRTLSGAELKLVGGAACNDASCCGCSCHTTPIVQTV
jgi:hypothetical protein